MAGNTNQDQGTRSIHDKKNLVAPHPFPYVSVNMEMTHRDAMGFPFLDYGFLYGYGLFESVRVYKKNPLILREHITRLRRGSIILDIPFPYEQEDIIKAAEDLIEKNGAQDAILNIYLTPGDRSPDPAQLTLNDPFLLMILRPWPNYDKDTRVSLAVRQISFLRTPLDRFKTLSWMKNVLEKKLTQDADDVLLYDKEKRVLETSRANVFFVKGKQLITPKESSVLTGITRQYLLNHQDELGYEVVLREVYMSELHSFDEIFLTNALKGIIKVQSLEDYPSLSSKAVTEQVQARYLDLIGIA